MDIRRAGLTSLSFMALLFAIPAAFAQSTGIPPEIEKKLREIGPISAPNETRPLYAPLQEKEPYQGVKVLRDENYGPDARNRLDVFTPEKADAAPRPILLFMHGGAYVGGDKTVAGSPFYSSIGVWAVRHGMVGVNMTYRLAPQHPWPQAEEDVGAAIRWVRANIAARGGDPAKIFLMGHSAGASHVATYLSHEGLRAPEGRQLAGAIIVSAFYKLDAVKTASIKTYFGDDRTLYAERSALPGLLSSKIPLMLAFAEFDTPDFRAQADIVKTAFCEHGQCPHLVMLPKHSHMSEIYSVNTADTGLSDQIAAFVKAHR